jgi:hypothetical protein
LGIKTKAYQRKAFGTTGYHHALNEDIWFSFFFFFLVVLGFELWASFLQTRSYTTAVIPPIHFAVVILQMGVS